MGHIHPAATIASSAVVTGDVTIGPGSRVLHGAIVNGGLGPVVVGADVVIMEHALLRARASHPLRVGDAVLIGPHTHLNGTTVEDEVFIATGVSMFPDPWRGRDASSGSTACCTSTPCSSRTPSCRSVGSPPGRPRQLFAPDQHEDLWPVQEPLRFPGTAYGVPRGTSMREIMRRQSAAFESLD